MKKILLLTIAGLFVVLNAYSQEQHPENCPFGGREDCTGYCGQFTDENGDGFCDYAILTKNKSSDIKKQDSITKHPITEVKETSKTKTTNRKEDTKVSSTNSPSNNLSDKESLQQIVDTQTVNSSEPVIQQESTDNNVINKTKTPYHFWSILIITIGLYIVSVAAVKTKKIKKTSQRKFWNIILLVTCLVSCLLGIYIVLAKMYGWSMNYMTVLKYHVDFGICMTIIAIIHIFWHITYWKNLFKGAKQKSIK